jgi:protein O-GlcNAc transferase
MLKSGNQEAPAMSNTLNKTLSISVALSLLLCGAASALAAGESDAQLAKADEMMKQKKPKQAVELLRQIISSNPDNAHAHMQLGAALASLAEKEQYDPAIKEEKEALRLDPKSFGARIILGHIYANLNKSAESIAILKEACEMRPGSYGAHRDLGIACLAGGKLDEAITAFKKAIEIKPKEEESHLKLSILLSKKGNFRDAIAEANEACQIAGGDPEAHLALANIVLESGDEGGSIEPFKRALAANKARNALTEANALSGLGWALAAKNAGKNDLDEGILDQRKALKVFPPFLPAYVRLAELLSKQDKNKEAEDSYKEALKISPDDAGVGTSYGKFLDRIGRKDEARAILKKVLDRTPNFKPAADALIQAGEPRSK